MSSYKIRSKNVVKLCHHLKLGLKCRKIMSSSLRRKLSRSTSLMNLLCDDSEQRDGMLQFNVRINVSNDFITVLHVLNHFIRLIVFNVQVQSVSQN